MQKWLNNVTGGVQSLTSWYKNIHPWTWEKKVAESFCTNSKKIIPGKQKREGIFKNPPATAQGQEMNEQLWN